MDLQGSKEFEARLTIESMEKGPNNWGCSFLRGWDWRVNGGGRELDLLSRECIEGPPYDAACLLLGPEFGLQDCQVCVAPDPLAALDVHLDRGNSNLPPPPWDQW